MDTSHDAPSGANSPTAVPPVDPSGATAPPKIAPALLFVLVCLALVRRERPDWVSDVTVVRVAESLGVDPTYVSRTASRFYGPARTLLDALTRRGRRPSATDDARARELHKVKAQLGVARAMLLAVPRRAARLREVAVGAYARLRDRMTRGEFCKALGLSERTFREWCRHTPAIAARPDISPAADPAPPPKPRAKPKRSLRRPRFQFDVYLPGVQLGGDTTALRLFNTDLKVVASQDIGGRGLELFKKTVIDTTETAAHVIEAFTAALEGCPGMQVVTDQGSPFMAADTVEALEKLGADHAPQKEGDPCGKATVERGFGVLKDILQPLLDVTNGLASRIPFLADQTIAIATARQRSRRQGDRRDVLRRPRRRRGEGPRERPRRGEERAALPRDDARAVSSARFARGLRAPLPTCAPLRAQERRLGHLQEVPDPRRDRARSHPLLRRRRENRARRVPHPTCRRRGRHGDQRAAPQASG